MMQLHDCSQALTCLFGCFNFTGGGLPMNFDFGCIANCRSLTCPSAGTLFDDVANCAIGAFLGGMCSGGGGIGCITTVCGSEIRACFAQRCPP
jgi:hypothetical protein